MICLHDPPPLPLAEGDREDDLVPRPIDRAIRIDPFDDCEPLLLAKANREGRPRDAPLLEAVLEDDGHEARELSRYAHRGLVRVEHVLVLDGVVAAFEVARSSTAAGPADSAPPPRTRLPRGRRRAPRTGGHAPP